MHFRFLTHTQDPKAALTLVTTKPSNIDSAGPETLARQHDGDVDLKRAKDLLDLHAAVRVAHQDGMDRELNSAREAVAKVTREL